MLRELETTELTVGMYVADLDRPWLETPFPVQGFYVRCREDIDTLARFCRHVFVDPRRYDRRLEKGGEVRLQAAEPRAEPKMDPGQWRAATRLPRARVTYRDAVSVEDELPAARQALDSSAATFEHFWSEISARRRIPITEVRAAIDPLVDSILRNRDALVALMRVQRIDQHTHDHCLAMAVWAGLMGRQLGLAPDMVKRLALGCSLVDMGKVRLPKWLLDKADPLSKSELAIVRSHVDYSVEMLAQMGKCEQDVQAAVQWHHERMDGSGYPDGLSGNAVPMFARIAGILDSYDAMISPRSPAEPRSSFESLTELQDQCPEKYQTELVEQFAQAVGIFPSGCLVELSTGEVAVVFSQNTGRRLRPKVLLILDKDKRRRDDLVVVDLNQDAESPVRIARELPHGAYGVDAKEFFL